jgi:hypothetical protein
LSIASLLLLLLLCFTFSHFFLQVIHILLVLLFCFFISLSHNLCFYFPVAFCLHFSFVSSALSHHLLFHSSVTVPRFFYSVFPFLSCDIFFYFPFPHVPLCYSPFYLFRVFSSIPVFLGFYCPSLPVRHVMNSEANKWNASHKNCSFLQLQHYAG